jgi:hypothetical protein
MSQLGRQSTSAAAVSTGARSGAAAIIAGARIDAQPIADVDEQRHLDDSPGGQLRRLGAAGGRVAAHARIGLGHLELDEVRGRHRDRLVVPERNGVGFLFLQPLQRIADNLTRGFHLLEAAVGFHEVPALAIGVEKFHFRFDDVGAFERLTGFEGALPDSPRLEVAQLHAVERLPLAGLDELVFDDRAGIALQHHLQARTKFIGRIARHTPSTAPVSECAP